MAESLAKRMVTPADARKERHQTIATAFALARDAADRGEVRRHSELEVLAMLQEADDWIAEDPLHDASKHLGVMSDDMRECPGCYAQMAGTKPQIEYVKAKLNPPPKED